MITGLDEFQLHQVAETFDNTNVSDHRFFDRVWMGLQSPSGDLALIAGVGVYKNNNVMDGFVCIQENAARQYNHRFSRRLRPETSETRMGPFRVTVLEPLQRIRIQLEPGRFAGSCDIEWKAVLPPHEEPRHREVANGRMVNDYIRFAQFGACSGWIEVEGRRTEFENWFGSRDHSWGVRPGVGGFEPANGAIPLEGGHFGVFCWFLTKEAGGVLQLQENSEGERRYLDGRIDLRNTPEPQQLKVCDIRHDFELVPGTRLFRRGRLEAVTADGATWEIEAESIGRAWLYKGSGYDSGYEDERGLGVWRGDWLEEYDVYDVSDPEACVLPDGRIVRPMHREQIARVVVNGCPGLAHVPFFIVGPNRRYKLER